VENPLFGKTPARDPNNRIIITKMRWDERSLVDRPANGDAIFTTLKTASVRQRGYKSAKCYQKCRRPSLLLQGVAALKFPNSLW
jgi:hypothetical protein